MKLEIGSVVKFGYNGKVREVKIEVVKRVGWVNPKPVLITGWDFRADGMRGAYRSFKVENMRALAIA